VKRGGLLPTWDEFAATEAAKPEEEFSADFDDLGRVEAPVITKEMNPADRGPTRLRAWPGG